MQRVIRKLENKTKGIHKYNMSDILQMSLISSHLRAQSYKEEGHLNYK